MIHITGYNLITKIPPVAVAAVSLLFGMVMLFQQQQLPSPVWGVILLPLAVISHRTEWGRPLVWLVAGFLWAAFMAELRLAVSLPDELEKKDLQLVGEVVDIPQRKSNGSLRFLFQIESAEYKGELVDLPALARISWYRTQREVKAGERWSLRVRLKQPHGFMNPGGFDYEKWLFQQGIRATGYVRKDPGNRVLNPSSSGLDSLRAELTRWISENSRSERADGILSALAVGDRQGIEEREWDVFRQTGTSHLMAISGLHIGLVSGLFFFLFRWLWSIPSRLLLMVPAQQAGAVGGFLGALGYAALAGFAIPTQRALIMVSVVMAMILLKRAVAPWTIYFTALIAILLLDPFAVLSAGFWLSFGAVGLILYGLAERRGGESKWLTMIRIQWVLAIGMLPMLLFLFRQGSLIAPVANIIAVPWVSLIVVPLNLLASLLHLLSISGAEQLLRLSAEMFEWIWPLLEWFSDLALSHFGFHQPELWTVLLAMVGAILILSPVGWSRRWPGVVALLPLLLLSPERPDKDEAWVTVLDVGQGLSTVVESMDKVMVYDTGNRFSATFNAGDAVVVPFLKSRGWKRVDLLVIGHDDRDHIGGMDALMKALPVVESISSVPEQVTGATNCLAGESWMWNGVSITVIHPDSPDRFKGNNGSCVIRIDAGGESLLLTGDIEKEAEHHLLSTSPELLDVDGVVVPHHGSNTSSTAEWIDAVSPAWAAFPVGYKNRYRFPKQKVVERYRRGGVRLFETAHTGSLQIRLGRAELPVPWRQFSQKIWSDVN